MRHAVLDPTGGRRILITDTDPTSRHVLERRLAREGYDVTACEATGDALDLLQHGGFDLLMIDRAVPGALLLVRACRAEPALVDLPILVVTARHDAGAAVEALDAGADDHLARPLDFGVLAARIRRLLGRADRIAVLRIDNEVLGAKAAESDDLRRRLADTDGDRARVAAAIRALEQELGVLSSAASAP